SDRLREAQRENGLVTVARGDVLLDSHDRRLELLARPVRLETRPFVTRSVAPDSATLINSLHSAAFINRQRRRDALGQKLLDALGLRDSRVVEFPQTLDAARGLFSED